jgi:anti-sigma B factor antagonist
MDPLENRKRRMKVVETDAEGVMVVEAYGRLDSTTSKAFRDRLISLLETGPGAVVVDLKNIAYISSAGFQALLIANRAAARLECKLALCGATREVSRLFGIGGFTDEFLIFPSQADGIGKLRP